jgi:predicted NUDIX family NTP pyrophosphohydrolase
MRKSAGILAYRYRSEVEVFLVHPGGPYYKNKDKGVWSIPKGEFEDEPPLLAAKREFLEETGCELKGDFIELQPIKQKAGKIVYAWAIQFDMDEQTITSNKFLLEWPPKSGKLQEFDEIDKAGWFTAEEAKEKINQAQYELIRELVEKVIIEDGSKRF